MSKTRDTHDTSERFGALVTSLWQRLTARQIKWRLTLAYVSVIYLSMTAIGLYLSYSIEKQYRSELYNILQSHARLARNLIEEDLDHNGIPRDYNKLCSSIGQQIHARVEIIDNGHRILGDSESPGVHHDISSEQMDQRRLLGSFGCRFCHPEVRSSQSISVVEPLLFKGHTFGTTRVSSTLYGVKRVSARIRRLIFATLVIAAVFAAFLSQRLAANIANPISKMNSMARKMADGDLNQRVSVEVNDEVGELASSFNLMAARLQKMINEMSEDKNKMETILTTMADGIIVTDEKANVLLFNKASERIFNLKSGDVVGKRMDSLTLHPELSNMVSDTLASRGLVRREIHIEGSPETVISAYCSPVKDSSSRIKGTVMVMHDLTEIRQHEKAQKDFVGNVSHELRTPITAIRVTAEALISGAKNDPKLLDRFLNSLVAESERLSLLIDDLLEIARREAGRTRIRRSDISVRETVDRILSLYNTEIKKNNLTVKSSIPHHITAYADERQFEQVMQNLIDNAIKYTPENGRLSISADQNDDWTTVSVADTGIGIPQSDVSRIFERFYRVDKARSRQKGGTGLGLAIVREIVEGHGGSITVQTKLGEGSTFTFLIPTKQHVENLETEEAQAAAP